MKIIIFLMIYLIICQLTTEDLRNNNENRNLINSNSIFYEPGVTYSNGVVENNRNAYDNEPLDDRIEREFTRGDSTKQNRNHGGCCGGLGKNQIVDRSGIITDSSLIGTNNDFYVIQQPQLNYVIQPNYVRRRRRRRIIVEEISKKKPRKENQKNSKKNNEKKPRKENQKKYQNDD
jgi:hypothetical protein